MKRLLILPVLLLCGAILTQAQIPTLVQSVSVANSEPNTWTSAKIHYPQKTLANNLLVLMLQRDTSSCTSVVVTDDQSQTWTQATTFPGGQILHMFYKAGSASNVFEVTVAYTGCTPAANGVVLQEYYNVATSSPVDGTPCGNGGTGTSITCGNITSSAANSLFIQYAVQDTVVTPITSWGQGSSPWKLDVTDIIDSQAAQHQVLASAGTLNPTMSMAPSNHWDTIGVAFKAAGAGTAPLPGIHVVHVQHQSFRCAVSASPVAFQFPTTGNLIVLDAVLIDPLGTTSVSVADSNGNTYNSTGALFNDTVGSGGSIRFHADNATTSTTMTGPTLTFSGSCSSGGSTVLLYDISGAAAAPHDSTAGRAAASSNQSSTASSFVGPTITPTTANELILCNVGVEFITVNGFSASTGGTANFLSAVPAPITNPDWLDQNNGWGLQLNSGTAATSFTWSETGSGGVGHNGSTCDAFAPAGGGGGGDFSLGINPSSQTIGTTDSANYSLTLQAMNGFNGAVQLTCNGLPAGATCSLQGQSISLSSSPASLVIQTQNVSPATFNFSIVGTSGPLMHTASAQLIVSPPGVTGSIAPPTSATVAIGGSANFSLSVKSVSAFSGSVSLACPGVPAGITCQFTPPSPITIGSNASQQVTLIVDVTAKPAAAPFEGPINLRGSRYSLLPFGAAAWIGVVIVLLVLTGHFKDASSGGPRRIASAAIGAFGLLLVAGLCSCGSGGGGGGGGGGPVTVQFPVQASAGGTNVNLGSVSITIP